MNVQARLAAIALVCASAAASADAARDASPEPLPQSLRATGLFVEGSATEVQPELLPFSPQYPLWSDGAAKRRWIYLPEGTFIDAARPDAWEFPPGTKLWKEFALERRVETRLIERLADGSWRYATYVWNDDDSDAVLAPPEGIPALPLGQASGPYAVPSEPDCRACHEGAAVPVLGFSALQLSPDRDPHAPHAEPGVAGADIASLAARGWLRNLPDELRERAPRIAAASPAERAALGYLHGNCGHCHGRPGDAGSAVPIPVLLAQQAAAESTAEVLRSLVGAPSRFRPPGTTGDAQLVAPGRAHESVLPARMRSRDPRVQMPPLGTAIPDSEALALIERWIDRELPKDEETLR